MILLFGPTLLSKYSPTSPENSGLVDSTLFEIELKNMENQISARKILVFLIKYISKLNRVEYEVPAWCVTKISLKKSTYDGSLSCLLTSLLTHRPRS